MSKAPPKPTSQTCSGISVRIVGTSSSGIRPLCNLGNNVEQVSNGEHFSTASQF